MENEIIVQPSEQYLSVAQVKNHIAHVHKILKDVMVEGKVVDGKIVKDGHYGKLPGCGDKKILFKSGAEKLCLAFNLVPRYNINILPVPENDKIPPGHRDYEVTCELFNRATGLFVGQGEGSCATLESKYRFRTKWINRQPIKEDNPNLADIYNTVKKMACKRAIVHAVIQTLAVGDIFMQDVEDMKPEDINGKPTKPFMSPPKSKSDQEKLVCPACGAFDAVIKGKEEYGGGWVCYKKKDGCGNKWGQNKQESPKPTGNRKIEPDQMECIQATFRDINKGWGSDQKRDMANTLINRKVKSMTDLTYDEAEEVKKGLKEMLEMKKENKIADADHVCDGPPPF
jgi:hypothetical protein